MSECAPAKMFCPYCQHAVLPCDTSISGPDHRWCFIHLFSKGYITGSTPEENRASWIAICTAHVPPKAKPRKVKISPEQRTTTHPGPLMLSKF